MKKKTFFLLEDITAIEWESREVRPASYNGRSGIASARRDELVLTLKNGEVFGFEVVEYSNFDELRAWFLNYGKKKGLVKQSKRSSRRNR